MVLNTSGNDRDSFSPTMLVITHDAHNAITLFWYKLRCCWLIATTLFIWLSACWTGIYSTAIGGIYQTIRHTRSLSSLHDPDARNCTIQINSRIGRLN